MLKFIFILFACCLAITAAAQPSKKEQLLQQRQQIDREITQLKQQLQQTEQGLGQVNNRQQQLAKVIAGREALIQSIDRQAAVIDRQIGETTGASLAAEAQLKQLKAAYARSLSMAYMHRQGTGMIDFIFSAENFNDALRRMQYMRQYRQHRARQLQMINTLSNSLRQKNASLAQASADKQAALAAQGHEIQALERTKQQLRQSAAEWQQQQKLVKGSIAARQQRRRQITGEIARIIRKAVSNASGKPVPPRGVTGGGNGTAAAGNSKTNAATGFLANKGRLNCPVNGYVYMRYGVNKIEQLTVDNSFLSLGTSVAGAPVKAVYDGTVKSVSRLPEDNTSIVIVEHTGGYFSVYANLATVLVAKGQAITAGQQLGGTAVNEDKPGHGLLEFMMMKGTQTQNPSVWVGCR